MEKLIGFFIKNRLFGDLLSIFIVLFGIISVFQIKREVFPNVSFDIITIQTLYPGASAQEMEKLVTNPIEQDLKEVDGIKKLQSISTEGRSYIIATLDPDQVTEQEAKDDIKSVIDQVNIPEEPEEPLVVALKSKQQPIIEVALSSEADEIKLREVAKDLEKKIEAIPGVARIAYKGIRDLEIKVSADPKKLADLSVSLDELIQSIKFQNNSIPAGTLDPDPEADVKSEKIIRTVGEYKDALDVSKTVVRANEVANAITVGDVAKVEYDLEERKIINKSNGVFAITLVVIKKETADAIKVVDKVMSVVDEFKRNQSYIPFKADFVNDVSQFIRNRLSILTSNMITGLILVIICLSLFLPFKVTLVVSAGIFISFLGTMAFFNMAGYSINLISLLGLIIVSGMLVDDAIVVTDNVTRYMQDGIEPEKAAIKGSTEIWSAVTASVLTTVVAFLPMLFMSGIFGKFVRQIPLGVVVALIASLLESLLIVPQHISSYIKLSDFDISKNPKGFTWVRSKFLNFWENKLIPRYTSLVALFIKRRYLTLFSTFLILLVSIGLSYSFLKFILFPPEGVEIFFIRTKTQTGITLEESAKRIEQIEKYVIELPKNELKNFVTTVGLMQQDPNDPETKRGPEYVQIAVYLTPETERNRTADEIIKDLRKKIGLPENYLEVKFDRVKPGPPVGKPISLGVQGLEYEDILPAVTELKEKVKSVKGAKDISDSYNVGKPEIHIIPKAEESAAAGLNALTIGTTVRAAVDGIVATSIQRLEDEVDIRITFDDKGKSPNEIIKNIKIPNKMGNLIPLSRIADIKEVTGISNFDHKNNSREVLVTAEVDLEVSSSKEANEYIRKNILPEMNKKHPNLKFVFGGEDEDTQESLASLLRAFLLAFMAIFLILLLTFKNLLQPFLVLLTIPVGVTAVMLALLVNGQPISFMAMLGVVALAGVIVNNAIILIDFVNQARSEGMEKTKSIIEAARLRLRPIFLTTMTTVFGLLPTAHGIGGLDKFVVPIAMALGYGLLIGSILTVFVFPAAIAVLDDIQAKLDSIFSKKIT